MTLTIEVPTDVESALASKARRLGVPVERYAAGVLERDVESDTNGAARNPLARALTLRDELAATIQAGTFTGGAKLDAAADLAALRDERFADA